jgi:hypothetical protein
MLAVGVWEHLNSNPHCHVLVCATDDERSWLLHEGNAAWLALQPRGQFDVGEIESRPKVTRYITKEMCDPDSQDQLFIYRAPLSTARR